MSTKSFLSVTVALALLAVAAVLGVVMGQRAAVGQLTIAIEATPETATNLVNTDHTVTATVTDDGVPAQEADVTFDITAGPNVGESHADVTNAEGQAFFTYTGDGGIGTDTIHVCVWGIIPQAQALAAQQVELDCVDVEKEWIEPTPSPTPAPTPTPTAAPTPTPTPTAPAAPDILPPSGGEPGSDGGFPWAVVGLALGGLVLLASGAALMRRAR